MSKDECIERLIDGRDLAKLTQAEFDELCQAAYEEGQLFMVKAMRAQGMTEEAIEVILATAKKEE